MKVYIRSSLLLALLGCKFAIVAPTLFFGIHSRTLDLMNVRVNRAMEAVEVWK